MRRKSIPMQIKGQMYSSGIFSHLRKLIKVHDLTLHFSIWDATMLQIVKMDLMSKIVLSNVFILTRFLMFFSSEHMIRWFQWQCSDQLSCIKQDQRCDGIRHCKDNSDEGDCQKPPIIKVSLLLTPTQLNHLRNYTTRKSFLKIKSSKLYILDEKCDKLVNSSSRTNRIISLNGILYIE